MDNANFDCCLCHHHADQPMVTEICHWLSSHGINPFLDQYEVLSGASLTSQIRQAMDDSASCVVFIGANEVGLTQRSEIHHAREKNKNNAEYLVIPVLLPGADRRDEKNADLWFLLADLLYLELSAITDEQAFRRLLASIQRDKTRLKDIPLHNDALKSAIAQASTELLCWPTQTDSNWLARPEADDIVERLRTQSHSTTVLLGEPGSGKTALLAHIGLFERVPGLYATQAGILLIANSLHWVDGDVARGWLRKLLQQPSGFTRQALGELLVLFWAMFPDCDWAKALSQQTLQKSDSAARRMQTGMAFAAAYLWEDYGFKPVATEVFVQLLQKDDAKIQSALACFFYQSGPLCDNAYSQSVIDVFCAYPAILNERGVEELLNVLQACVNWGPTRVARLCEAYLHEVGKQVGDIHYPSAAYLVDIAIRLQRLSGDCRVMGVSLFEKMLALGLDTAEKTMSDIDDGRLMLNAK